MDVLIAAVIDTADFTRISDPTFVPERLGDTELAAGTSGVLFLRVAVDCTVPRSISTVSVEFEQGSRPAAQDITALVTNGRDSELDLEALPVRACT
jgi:hypothetical protein